MPAKALKAADKQAILKKLVTEMKRRYGGSLPKSSRSTFETLMFSACLENSDQDAAEAAYSQLLDAFFDLNEIRVSSVNEIETALGELTDADWKSMRIREVLQHTFEKHYAFDLEGLRRKTQDGGMQELAEIPYTTPFMRTYTVQHALGAHALPVDDAMLACLKWLGLTIAEHSAEETGEDLKSAVKKADGLLVCHLLRCVATDPKLRPVFEQGVSEPEALDPFEAPKRLAELFKNPSKALRKTKPKAKAKSVSHKKPVKKTRSRSETKTKKAAKKVTKKRPTKKKTARKATK